MYVSVRFEVEGHFIFLNLNVFFSAGRVSGLGVFVWYV